MDKKRETKQYYFFKNLRIHCAGVVKILNGVNDVRLLNCGASSMLAKHKRLHSDLTKHHSEAVRENFARLRTGSDTRATKDNSPHGRLIRSVILDTFRHDRILGKEPRGSLVALEKLGTKHPVHFSLGKNLHVLLARLTIGVLELLNVLDRLQRSIASLTNFHILNVGFDVIKIDAIRCKRVDFSVVNTDAGHCVIVAKKCEIEEFFTQKIIFVIF